MRLVVLTKGEVKEGQEKAVVEAASMIVAITKESVCGNGIK